MEPTFLLFSEKQHWLVGDPLQMTTSGSSGHLCTPGWLSCDSCAAALRGKRDAMLASVCTNKSVPRHQPSREGDTPLPGGPYARAACPWGEEG